MQPFLGEAGEKKGVNKIFIAALLAAAAVVTIVIVVLSFRPSLEDRMAQVLATGFHEGDPGFADLSKDIIIATDRDHTIESPMATGRISMFIHGTVCNKGPRTIDVLEINVGVVTQFNQVLKEKRVLVVPMQVSELGPNPGCSDEAKKIPVTLTLDGFNKEDDRANIRWKVTAIKAK